MDEKFGALDDSGTDQLAKTLWAYVVSQCKDAEVMVKVVNSGKKSSELAAHITSYAKKKAVKGSVMLQDSKVFGEVNKFYGIEELVKVFHRPAALVAEDHATEETKSVSEVPKSVPRHLKSVPKSKKAIPEGQFDLFGMGV